MSADSVVAPGSLIPDRVLLFAPASMTSRDRIELATTQLDVRYRVGLMDGDDIRALPGDPTVAAPAPWLRLVVNVVATFALTLVAGLVVAATAPRIFGYGSVVVTSGSMEPRVQRSDVVITTSPADAAGLAEGSVINFERDGKMILHRIAAVTPEGYRTAGDSNSSVDADPVSPPQVRGVGIVVVPFVGLPATWAERGQWSRLAAALLVLVTAGYMSSARWLAPDHDPLRP